MIFNTDAIIATAMTEESPLLYDTSTVGANGSPYSMASAPPTTTIPRYSYARIAITSMSTTKHGWRLRASSTSEQPKSASTSSSPATTTQASVFTPAEPTFVAAKSQRVPSLYIAIIALVVVTVVVVVALVLFTWLRRRKQVPQDEDDGFQSDFPRPPTAAIEKPAIREPELSWMTGPTLIDGSDPDWSAHTLVPLNSGHPQRGLAEQGVVRETATPPPPIPPRSLSRRAVPLAAGRRRLPAPPASFTPLTTPVSPISPARAGREPNAEDEILPVVDNESYRPSPVSPLEHEGFARSRSLK